MALNTNQLAEREALRILNKGNSNLSPKANTLLSILEGAEGSLSLREKISAYIKSQFGDLIGDNQDKLDQLNSIKEKLAYLINLTDNDDRESIIQTINDIINSIEKEILKTEDYSESAIIRLSALNRFDVKLTSTEKKDLYIIGNSMLQIAKDNNLSVDLNLFAENDAQKIYKIKILINSLIKKGLISEKNTQINDFESKFQNKLDKLNDLDNKYHDLNETRNFFYRIQRTYGKIEVLSKNKEQKLVSILKSMLNPQTTGEGRDNQSNQNLLDLNKLLNSSSLPTELTEINKIESLLNTLKHNFTFNEALKSQNLSESEFDRYFLLYFAVKALKQSKIDFDSKKQEVFGDKLRDFDGDIIKWRNMQRDRIVHFANQEPIDIDSLENIFDRDRKLFILNGTFNNLQEGDGSIIEGLSAVIERRYASLNPGQRQELVRTIVCENIATNELYYSDTNRFLSERKDNGLHRFFNFTRKSGPGIENVNTYTTKIVKPFMNFGRSSLEFLSEKTNKIVTLTTQKTFDVIKLTNTKISSTPEGKWKRRLKYPFKSVLLLTKPIEWGAQFTNWGTTKTLGLIGDSYKGLNKAISDADIKNINDEKVDNLFSLLTASYSYSLNLFGKGTGLIGEKGYDFFKTKQKRKILQDFYSTRANQDIRAILEAIDLQSKLRDSSPYIFDDEEDILVGENTQESEQIQGVEREQQVTLPETDIQEEPEQELELELEPEPEQGLENEQQQIEQTQGIDNEPEEEVEQSIGSVTEPEQELESEQLVDNNKTIKERKDSLHKINSELTKINNYKDINSKLSELISTENLEIGDTIVLGTKSEGNNLVIKINKFPNTFDGYYEVDYILNRYGKKTTYNLDKKIRLTDNGIVFLDKNGRKRGEYDTLEYSIIRS
ncbi:MAG: hypothetical protein PHN31_00715 [Candidatus Gracilibacteria bacterium]|nr:hypothetical protein [Candidatus Gracilibacteria bacterium]